MSTCGRSSAPRAPVPLAHPLIEAGTYVNAVAFSPDGRTLAAGIANGDVQLLTSLIRVGQCCWGRR